MSAKEIFEFFWCFNPGNHTPFEAALVHRQTKTMATSTIKVGAKVTIPAQPEKGVGVVRYHGTPQFAEGVWVGIELDHQGIE
jgi:hypothetical protein